MSKKIFVMVILCLIIFNPIKVVAISEQMLISHHSYELESEVNALGDSSEENEEIKFSILGALKYRLFEKDTRDIWDYLLLATFIVGMLIVMVFRNTRYYYVKIQKENDSVKLEDNDIQLIEKIEPKKRTRNNNYYKKGNYHKKDN